MKQQQIIFIGIRNVEMGSQQCVKTVGESIQRPKESTRHGAIVGGWSGVLITEVHIH